ATQETQRGTFTPADVIRPVPFKAPAEKIGPPQKESARQLAGRFFHRSVFEQIFDQLDASQECDHVLPADAVAPRDDDDTSILKLHAAFPDLFGIQPVVEAQVDLEAFAAL